MTTKLPRDLDEPMCDWCEGAGQIEFTLPDGTIEKGPCDRCKGTGYARFDPTDLLARTRDEA